ncbi:MAG: hypothetical protein AAGK04_07195, partial [Planctomycetota bacterium]
MGEKVAKSDGRAHAKAKILKIAMQLAGRLQLSARAQAILAHVLAESWLTRDQKHWEAVLAFSILEDRLSCTRYTIRRAADELQEAGIVHVARGDKRRPTRWSVPVGLQPCTPGGAPVHPGGCTHAPSEGAPMHPTTRTRSSTAIEPSCAAGSDDDSIENRPLAESTLLFLEQRERMGRSTRQRVLADASTDQRSQDESNTTLETPTLDADPPLPRSTQTKSRSGET